MADIPSTRDEGIVQTPNSKEVAKAIVVRITDWSLVQVQVGPPLDSKNLSLEIEGDFFDKYYILIIFHFMKWNKNILPAIIVSLWTVWSPVQWASFDDIIRNEPAIPMQKVESTWPAITWVQIKIQWKIYLLLLDPKDAQMFPESLSVNIGNIESKVKGVVQKMVSNGKIPTWANVSIESYWTTTAVDIGEWLVWFLTASHVIQSEKTPNDVCITNRIIGDSVPKTGFPILNISSPKVNKQMSYTQFPLYSQWSFTMVQIPSILHYEGMRQWISSKFDKFVWWASGAPVIIENPTKKWEYWIISIFPGWTTDNDMSNPIAQMPRPEVISEIKSIALKAAKKWWYYSICR